jgi:hypothetical protein
VPRNIRGTLTSSNLKSVYTSISTIMLYKSCAIATFKYLEPVPLKNYVRIVAFTFNLQRVLFYCLIVFLHYSITIKLLPPTILIKGCYLSLRASLLCWDVIISLIYMLRRANSCNVATLIGTSKRNDYLSRASIKQPRTSRLSPAALRSLLNLGNSLKTLTEFATSQGCGRCGLAILPTIIIYL